MAGSRTQRMADWIRAEVAAWPEEADADLIFRMLSQMARWRSRLLANTYAQHHGAVIMAGPFAGMTYVEAPSEGALMPRLLGSYESGLHPHLHELATEAIQCVVDIGAAEGYYAVGLARLLPAATVYAYDIDPAARAMCARLAERNAVSDRIAIRAEFRPTDFEQFAGRKTLAIVDVEGAELDLLRPDLSPSLRQITLIVETHDTFRPGTLAALTARFAPTHDVVQVSEPITPPPLPPWLKGFSTLDQLLALWEWRRRDTPWLVMTPR